MNKGVREDLDVFIVCTEKDIEHLKNDSGEYEFDIDNYHYVFIGKAEDLYYKAYPLGDRSNKYLIQLFDKYLPRSLTLLDSYGVYWTTSKLDDIITIFNKGINYNKFIKKTREYAESNIKGYQCCQFTAEKKRIKDCDCNYCEALELIELMPEEGISGDEK